MNGEHDDSARATAKLANQTAQSKTNTMVMSTTQPINARHGTRRSIVRNEAKNRDPRAPGASKPLNHSND